MRWRLVDRIDELVVGERVTGARAWPADTELFVDHFPEFPVVPGVLTLESLAQLAGKLIGYTVRIERGDWPFPILSMADKVKFRRFVRPEQEIGLAARLLELRDESAIVRVTATVDGKRVATAEQVFVFNAVPLDDPAECVRVEATERAELRRLWADYPGDDDASPEVAAALAAMGVGGGAP